MTNGKNSFYEDYKSKRTKIFMLHVILFVTIFIIIRFGCIFYRLFGLVCPCCGVTRAWLNFLKFDLKTAIYYHALFPLIPVYLFVFVHYNLNFMRKMKKISKVFLYTFGIILLLYNIYRLFFAENIFPNGII